MHCGEEIEIRGDVRDVLAVIVPVERWALLFPSIRRSRIIGRHGTDTVVELSTRVGFVPVRWTVEHTFVEAERRVIDRHLRGLARGMWTEWRVVEADDHVVVTVRHEWQPQWPLVGCWLGQAVCERLVQPATRQTLLAIRACVERGTAQAVRRLWEIYGG